VPMHAAVFFLCSRTTGVVFQPGETWNFQA
jgi:hypothetical protein